MKLETKTFNVSIYYFYKIINQYFFTCYDIFSMENGIHSIFILYNYSGSKWWSVWGIQALLKWLVMMINQLLNCSKDYLYMCHINNQYVHSFKYHLNILLGCHENILIINTHIENIIFFKLIPLNFESILLWPLEFPEKSHFIS